MTQIRAKTLQLLENLSDEKLIYVFNILQNLEAFSRSEEIRDEKGAVCERGDKDYRFVQ